ncbi:MAG TPA: hypothetical protein DEB31_03170 [Clostridiales bacterium]|nr:hypothetical protein [Clostridiales bacterium]
MEKTFMPEFANAFQCAGPACEYSCCQEWIITIDKKTYNKYRAAKDPWLKARVSQGLKRTPGGDSQQYASVMLDKETGLCPFLDEQSLCAWQKKLGEEYLSLTCRQYPRTAYKFDDRFEYTLKPSCPEVARIGMLPDKPLSFIMAETDPSVSYRPIAHYDPRYFRMIRDFVIDILQDRSFYFEYRLILLGLFLQKATQSTYKTINGVIAEYRTLFKDKSIIDQFASLPEIPTLQFAVWEKLNQLLDHRISSKSYVALIKDTFHGLGVHTEVQKADTFYKNYFDALMKYEKTFTAWEHVFENYFVNDVFMHPYDLIGYNAKEQKLESSIIWDYYIYLCVSYRILKLHFVGIHSLKGSLSNDDAVSIISKYDRAVFGHFKELITEITNWLKEKDASTLAYMAVLVRT